MTRNDALALADRILELVNSKPRTPTRDDLAALLDWSPECSDVGVATKDEILALLAKDPTTIAWALPAPEEWIQFGDGKTKVAVLIGEVEGAVDGIRGEAFERLWAEYLAGLIPKIISGKAGDEVRIVKWDPDYKPFPADIDQHPVEPNCPCGQWHGSGPKAEKCPRITPCVFEARIREPGAWTASAFCAIHQRWASECQPTTDVHAQFRKPEPIAHCDYNLTPGPEEDDDKPVYGKPHPGTAVPLLPPMMQIDRDGTILNVGSMRPGETVTVTKGGWNDPHVRKAMREEQDRAMFEAFDKADFKTSFTRDECNLSDHNFFCYTHNTVYCEGSKKLTDWRSREGYGFDMQLRINYSDYERKAVVWALAEGPKGTFRSTLVDELHCIGSEPVSKRITKSHVERCIEQAWGLLLSQANRESRE